jgi:DNA-directed RNA polymerase sigma subunit (sigma70/sigma32)
VYTYDEACEALRSGEERELSTEEVQRVIDALDTLGQIKIDPADDAAKIAKDLTEELDRWPDRHKALRELRRQAVIKLRNDKLSWQAIGTIMGVSRVRAQQIAEGATGPQGVDAKARRKKAMRKDPDAPAE